MKNCNAFELNLACEKNSFAFFCMIYNFTIALTRIYFAICEVRIRILNYYCSYYFINLAFCTGNLTDFLPIKQVRTNYQRLIGLLPISYVFKNLPSYTFTFFLTSSVFGAISHPLPIRHFYPKNLPPSNPVFHQPYPQSKTLLNMRPVPSSAIFCSNAVLTTPSSSMQFSSFFDLLPSAPTTTGMTLMRLLLHIILISFFSSRYLLIFSFFFSLTRMSPGIAIEYQL